MPAIVALVDAINARHVTDASVVRPIILSIYSE